MDELPQLITKIIISEIGIAYKINNKLLIFVKI